jgi:DNA-binding IclR family transcriptional regulator
MSEDSSSSVLRGVRTLVGLAELNHPASFGTVAKALQLPPSTVHRILALLKDAGFVVQDEGSGSYSPGPAFLRAATSFCAASMFPLAVRDGLEALVKESGESAYYAIWHSETQRLRFLTTVYSSHAVQYVARLEAQYSVLWGASGRSIGAFLPEKELRAIYLREKGSAEGTVPLPAWAEFRKEMARVREQGYCASTNQRFEGAHSIAAPVFGYDSTVIGCVGIGMPSLRYQPERTAPLSELVIDASAALSKVAQCGVASGGSELR